MRNFIQKRINFAESQLVAKMIVEIFVQLVVRRAKSFFIRELNVFREEKTIGERAALVKELPEDCGPQEDSGGGGDP